LQGLAAYPRGPRQAVAAYHAESVGLSPRASQAIGWAQHPVPSAVEDVGIDHGRAHVGMPEGFAADPGAKAGDVGDRLDECLPARRFQ